MSACPVVLTSTNAQYVQRLAGRDAQIFEVVVKPFDLDQVTEAAKQAVRSRPTR